MKTSPTLVFLFFGRKAILPSTVFWQSILYPPIFVKIIDTCLTFLFNWRGENIPVVSSFAFRLTHGSSLTRSVMLVVSEACGLFPSLLIYLDQSCRTLVPDHAKWQVLDVRSSNRPVL